MNRAERRAMARFDRQEASEGARFIVQRDAAKNAKKAQLERNGITAEDLKKAFDDGFDRGGRDATDRIGMIVICAMCLALSELHGFKRQRLVRIMERMCQIMDETFTTADAVQRVYKELGLKFDDSDPFNWLQFDDDVSGR